jgi:hypothetical protein
VIHWIERTCKHVSGETFQHLNPGRNRIHLTPIDLGRWSPFMISATRDTKGKIWDSSPTKSRKDPDHQIVGGLESSICDGEFFGISTTGRRSEQTYVNV